MWENATPMPPKDNVPKRNSSPPPEGNAILNGQILLCLLILAFVFLAKNMNWALFPSIRVAFDDAMRPTQELFLSDSRMLSKFTEKAAQAVENVTGNLFLETKVSTPETATRPVHGKSAPPSGASDDSYLPDFSLVFPLPDYCTRTSGYGWRADPMGGSGSDFHLGNDLAAAEGTVIQAAADGVVRYAGTHPSYGNYVRLLHQNGDETLYAHMQYLFVHTGETISAGTVLGTVGETGNATGPHLHFELLHRGIRYDPSDALQAAS